MHGRKNSFLSLQTPALNKIMSHRSGMTVFFILDLSYASQDFLEASNAGVISTNLIHTSHIKNPGAMRNVKGQPLYQGTSLPYRACTLEVYWIKGQSFAPRLA